MSEKSDEGYTIDAIGSGVEDFVLLGDRRIDSIMTAVVALGSELWATKRRMKVMERLLSDQGVGPQQIEQYMPSAEDTREWNAERDSFVAAVYGHFADPGADSGGG